LGVVTVTISDTLQYYTSFSNSGTSRACNC